MEDIYNLGIVYLPRIFLEDSIIDRKILHAMRVVYTKTLGSSGIDWGLETRIYAIDTTIMTTKEKKNRKEMKN